MPTCVAALRVRHVQVAGGPGANAANLYQDALVDINDRNIGRMPSAWQVAIGSGKGRDDLETLLAANAMAGEVPRLTARYFARSDIQMLSHFGAHTCVDWQSGLPPRWRAQQFLRHPDCPHDKCGVHSNPFGAHT